MPNSLIPFATSRGVGCLLVSNPNLSLIDSLKDKSGIELFNKSSIFMLDSVLEYLAEEATLFVELNLIGVISKDMVATVDDLSSVVDATLF